MKNQQDQWITELKTLCQTKQVRACLVLSGDSIWQTERLKNNFDVSQQGLWIGKNSPLPNAQSVDANSATQYLGQETDFVIFQGLDGLEPNLLGIFSGMIKAGGLCVIALPEQSVWLKTPNVAMQKYLSFPWQLTDLRHGYNAFIWHTLQQQALLLTPDNSLPSLTALQNLPDGNPLSLPTLDQQQGLLKIEQVAFGHRKRPLVISADRGRGKSTLLGLAAVALVNASKQSIVITAARRDQVQAAFRPINAAGLADKIHFKAPDDCLNNPSETDVLLVDEAAHLPLPLLLELVQKYPRVVLASTDQGYEGSGRSFALKLGKALQDLTPGWQALSLQTPIRWAPNDPLEACIKACLLQSHSKSAALASAASITYAQTSLTPQNPKQLQAIFSLLSHAHYQTSPNDLMQLLEMPDLKIWQATTDDGQCVGALIAIAEGGLASEFKHRFQGHLFAQLQAKNTHNSNWLGLKGWRIMRIAVADTWQKQGIGSALIKQCKTDFAANAAYLSSNFGATPGLVNFWQQNGFLTLHLGAKRDKASGVHSVSMASGLTPHTTELIAKQHQQFNQQLFYGLSDTFKDLNSLLIQSLYKQAALTNHSEFPHGYLAADAWAQPYEVVSFELAQWLLQQLANQTTQALQQPLLTLLIRKLLQKHTWADLTTPDLPGRKALELAIKQACQILLK